MSKNVSRRGRYAVPTPERLANAALFYVSRYAASEESLRRVLKNKIKRASMANESFADDREKQQSLTLAIESIIAKLKQSGAVNDEAYAEMKVSSLRRAGKSARRITQTLSHKGVAGGVIGKALEPPDEGDSRTEEKKAALVLARRRKWGPYRAKETPDVQKTKAKEFAAMARAGFSMDVIRDVLGGDGEGVFDEE